VPGGRHLQVIPLLLFDSKLTITARKTIQIQLVVDVDGLFLS
jgi:hypothetical protein